MDAAKIRLSQKELELVTNADWILTKNAIIQKINQLLGGLQIKQQQYVEFHSAKLPGKVSNPMAIGYSSKISKGENYKGLPYLILDYPRIFDHSTVFAIRTMFWWGNFFSVTLHLSGTYKKEAEEKLINFYQVLKEKGYYCCKNDDQWEHNFEADNYVLLSELNKNYFENLVREKSFIKLANKIPLQQWDNAEESLLTYFKQLIELLAD